MKKITVVMLAAVMLLVSCDLNSLFVKKSRIHINVKPLLYSEQLKSSASRAVLSFNEQTISVKAEAKGMTTVETTLVYDSASGVFSGSIEVQKNTPVTFTVEAKDAKGTVYVKGSDTKTITKDADNLAITMAPVLGETVKKEVEAGFLADMETAEKGSVFTVAFAPVIPFDLTYAIESKDVSVAVCNKEGKNLLNAQQEWNMKNGDEVIVLYTKTGEAPSLMVYPKIVVVSFDANGGTGTMEEQILLPDTATALTKNAFTREGWTFTGWNTAKDGKGTAYADAAEVKLSADAILFAQWKQNSVKVAFDANTGSGTMDVQTMAANTATVLTANAFTKEGWTFSGWNTAKDGTGTTYLDGAIVSLSSNKTLYAQWQENVVIKEKVTVTGTVTLNNPVTNAAWYVIIDTDQDGGNGYIGIDTGVTTGNSFMYIIENVPEGTYFLYTVTDVDGSWGGSPSGVENGDYWCFLGGTADIPPSGPNFSVLSSGTINQDLTTFIYGASGSNVSVVLSIEFEELKDEEIDLTSTGTGSLSKDNNDQIEVSYTGVFDSITWCVDGSVVEGGISMMFYASQYACGKHTITAIILYNGGISSKSVYVNVAE